MFPVDLQRVAICKDNLRRKRGKNTRWGGQGEDGGDYYTVNKRNKCLHPKKHKHSSVVMGSLIVFFSSNPILYEHSTDAKCNIFVITEPGMWSV